MTNAGDHDTLKVFRLLGLESEKEREQVRRLADPAPEIARGGRATVPCADTRNNTRREDDDA